MRQRYLLSCFWFFLFEETRPAGKTCASPALGDNGKKVEEGEKEEEETEEEREGGPWRVEEWRCGLAMVVRYFIMC